MHVQSMYFIFSNPLMNHNVDNLHHIRESVCGILPSKLMNLNMCRSYHRLSIELERMIVPAISRLG